MAEIIYKFDNTPWGGSVTDTLKVDEMPDWSPIGQEVKENFIRSNNGKVWKYEWDRKEAVNLSFRGVGTDVRNTMDTLVSDGVSFLWIKDVNDATAGTGTMVYSGGAFQYQPLTPQLNDFEFPMEELQP